MRSSPPAGGRRRSAPRPLCLVGLRAGGPVSRSGHRRGDQPGSLPRRLAACRELRPDTGDVPRWVLQITRTRVLNELRRRGRRPRATSDSDGAGAKICPTPGPGPAEAVWREHRRAVVREAVEALPPPQREALSLAFLEDLTHEQVAAFLELPLGTTKSRIRSGLKSPARPARPAGRGGPDPGRPPHLRRPPRARPPGRPATPGPRPAPGHQQRGRAATPGLRRPGSTRRLTATIAAVPASTWPS